VLSVPMIGGRIALVSLGWQGWTTFLGRVMRRAYGLWICACASWGSVSEILNLSCSKCGRVSFFLFHPVEVDPLVSQTADLGGVSVFQLSNIFDMMMLTFSRSCYETSENNR
jgi:hypothetical protein